jgi:hypothetical protein
MNGIVGIALVGWLPFSIAVFAVLSPRPAALITMIGGWLFLPVASLSFPGLPDYTKHAAVALGPLAGLVLFGSRAFAGLRCSWHDLPMLAWCAVPAASSLANGHDAHDAFGVTLMRAFEWGIPYLVGRALFRDLAAVSQLARGICIGGIVYAPFCLYEVRMSPQLHAKLYGFAQHDFAQCIRDDGYRPMVFMEHGLMVALWLCIASVAGLSLWRHGALRRIGGLPAGMALLPLFAATLLCRSMGALVLMLCGLGCAFAVHRLRSTLPLRVMLALPVAFVAARLGLDWRAARIVDLVGSWAPERARSLQFRIHCEDVQLADLWQRPYLGWSAWGPAVQTDADGTAIARDSYWLITVGNFGLVGLLLFFAIHLVPTLTLLRRVPVHEWAAPRGAGAIVLIVALAMFVFDCTFNAMRNPIYTVALGSLTSLATAIAHRSDAPAPLPRGPRRLFLPFPS